MIIIKMTEAHPKVISKTFMPGEVIFRENEHSQEMYIIIAGRIRILKNKGPDKEIILAELDAGAIFGEMSFISHEPRSATAVAINEVTCKLINAHSFSQSAGGIPPWAMSIAKVLVTRLRNINSTIKNKSDMVKDIDKENNSVFTREKKSFIITR
ncbi:MAG TPA: cyclic nucleotide-binding domain-containing protein, partial [Spirochaetota bacterium]|nr:cyclic nucleotide-binding domain-containing protein [Spirochaetota bacterium]